MEMVIDGNMLERLNNIHWFSYCGQGDICEDAMHIMNIADVKKSIKSIRWENIILDYCGDFTAQLSREYKEEYKEEYKDWNTLVKEFKLKYMPPMRKAWKTNLNNLGINEPSIIDDIAFNVLSIAVIDAYKNCISTPEFWIQLLDIYENGCLPCGWSGKKGNGKFIVF